jgi:predicted DNA-binding transcriptional regulator AlpA
MGSIVPSGSAPADRVELIPVEEYGEQRGWSRPATYRLAKNRDFPKVWLTSRRFLVSPTAVDQWLLGRTERPPPSRRSAQQAESRRRRKAKRRPEVAAGPAADAVEETARALERA